MPQKTTLQDRLLAAMAAARLKPAELAKRASVSAGYLSHLLSGEKTNPSDRVLAALAEALGVSVDWLKKGVGAMKIAEPVARYSVPGSWITDLRPALSGSPLENALPVHTLDVGNNADRAWRELEDDRKRDVLSTLRAMASIAILIERSLPKTIAERLTDDLARHVNEYIADAF